MCPGKGFTFLICHCPLGFQIILVANKHDRRVGIGMLSGVFEPSRQVVESVPPKAHEWQFRVPFLPSVYSKDNRMVVHLPRDIINWEVKNNKRATCVSITVCMMSAKNIMEAIHSVCSL